MPISHGTTKESLEIKEANIPGWIFIWSDQKDRKTERQKDRETERQRDRETERQRDRERETQRGRETERQRDRETERQRERIQKHRKADRQGEREGWIQFYLFKVTAWTLLQWAPLNRITLGHEKFDSINRIGMFDTIIQILSFSLASFAIWTHLS